VRRREGEGETAALNRIGEEKRKKRLWRAGKTREISYKQTKLVPSLRGCGQPNKLAGLLPGKESTYPSGAAAVALGCCPAQTQRTSSGLVTSTNFTAPDRYITTTHRYVALYLHINFPNDKRNNPGGCC
jgi:hypothetical protein